MSFEPLATELNDVAWTATSGGLTVKVAFSVIPGAAGTAITSAGVAAATAASTPGSVALLTAAVAKPGSIILGIAGLAVGAIAAVSMTGGEPGATLVDQQLPAAEAPGWLENQTMTRSALRLI